MNQTPSEATLLALSAAFDTGAPCVAAVPFGEGHINDTFRLDTAAGDSFVLQRINRYVFPQTAGLIDNFARVTAFLAQAVTDRGGDVRRECLQPIMLKAGGLALKQADEYWRMTRLITDAVSLQKAECPAQLTAAGQAFGAFARDLSAFPAAELCEVIPHFHDTPLRYQALLASVKKDVAGRAAEVADEIAFFRDRAALLCRVTDGLADGSIPLRVTHNDTKLNNVLLDSHTGAPLAVLDLDTVMPGSLLYDFGDGIRFGAATAVEDEEDLSKVGCDPALFAAFTEGYLAGLGGTVTPAERELLPFSAFLITTECAMRFLTDYLDGDVYFKTAYPLHNLVRCRNQIAMAADLERRQAELSALVARY